MTIDRRPIRWCNWAPRHMPTEPYTPWVMEPGNPHGYRRHNTDNELDYRDHPEDFIRSQLSRGQRCMSRMEFPTAKLEKGQIWGWGVPSTFWYGIDRERRELLIREILARKREDGDFTWGPYIGGAMSSPYTLSMVTADHVCDLGDAADRKAFEVSLLPWLEAGAIDEIGFDALARHQLLGAGKKLIEDLDRLYGIKAVIEAYPHYLGPGGKWPDDIMWVDYKWPMWCLAAFIEPRDPDHLLSFDPETTEVHVCQQPHVPIDVASYEARGFIVGDDR